MNILTPDCTNEWYLLGPQVRPGIHMNLYLAIYVLSLYILDQVTVICKYVNCSMAQVFGHGWLCPPTSPRGQFSENFYLLAGFVIQDVKVQT